MVKDDRDLTAEMTNYPNIPTIDKIREIPLMENTEKFNVLFYDGDEVDV